MSSLSVSLRQLKNLQITMRKITLFLLTMLFIAISCKEAKETNGKAEAQVNKAAELKIHPIKHATAVLEYDGKTIYIDPTGGAEAFKDYKKADEIRTELEGLGIILEDTDEGVKWKWK